MRLISPTKVVLILNETHLNLLLLMFRSTAFDTKNGYAWRITPNWKWDGVRSGLGVGLKLDVG